MIWKALSDPTRRSILDLLKSAPRTTGEISEHFEENLSRFAIMKHLGILEKAQLITIRREGKYRWNHLNTGPIQKTYDEWLDQLIQLQYYTDSSSRKTTSSQRMLTSTFDTSITLKASKLITWNTLTQQTNQWWLSDFYQHQDTQEMRLDPKIGGLLYEDTSDSEGVVWATVIALDSPNHILLKGDLSPDFGGPAISFLKINLEARKQNTLLTLHNTIMGSTSTSQLQSIKKQWTALLQSLKRFIEK